MRHDRLRGRHHEHALDVPFLVLAQFDVRLLEWVGAKVEHKRRAQRRERLLPDAKPLVLLLEEDDLPLIVAKARQVAVVGPVEELPALVVAAGEKIMLVVAVEMDLEGLSVGVVAVQQLRGDVRLSGSRARVGTQSSEEKMPFTSVCGFTTSGQRMTAGAR